MKFKVLFVDAVVVAAAAFVVGRNRCVRRFVDRLSMFFFLFTVLQKQFNWQQMLHIFLSLSILLLFLCVLTRGVLIRFVLVRLYLLR